MIPDRHILAAKIALEAELTATLTRTLPGYVNELASDRLTMSAREVWRLKLVDLLVLHYARVVSAMRGLPMRKRPPLDEVALSMDHAFGLRRRASQQAALLMQGMDRGLTIVNAIDEKGIIDGLSRKAKQLWDWLKSKIPSIANQETQEPAEATRHEEATQRAGNRRLQKWWSSMNDDRVRPAHEAAEGQVQDALTPFTVGGELMMYPGDATYGASLGNRINCRCSARWFAVNHDGTTEALGGTPRGGPAP